MRIDVGARSLQAIFFFVQRFGPSFEECILTISTLLLLESGRAGGEGAGHDGGLSGNGPNGRGSDKDSGEHDGGFV